MITNLRSLSFICFILPISTVTISYLISIKLDLVPACIPNLDGCTSISRAGRYEPVKYFFKPMMYFYGIILIFFWLKLFEILKKLEKKESNIIFLLALFSVIFLFLYVTFLGESNIYRFFRKIGIYIYIFLTVLTEFLVSKRIYDLIFKANKFFNNFYVRLNYYLTILLVILGIILLPVLAVKIETFPQLKNIISTDNTELVNNFEIYFSSIVGTGKSVSFAFSIECWSNIGFCKISIFLHPLKSLLSSFQLKSVLYSLCVIDGKESNVPIPELYCPYL